MYEMIEKTNKKKDIKYLNGYILQRQIKKTAVLTTAVQRKPLTRWQVTFILNEEFIRYKNLLTKTHPEIIESIDSRFIHQQTRAVKGTRAGVDKEDTVRKKEEFRALRSDHIESYGGDKKVNLWGNSIYFASEDSIARKEERTDMKASTTQEELIYGKDKTREYAQEGKKIHYEVNFKKVLCGIDISGMMMHIARRCVVAFKPTDERGSLDPEQLMFMDDFTVPIGIFMGVKSTGAALQESMLDALFEKGFYLWGDQGFDSAISDKIFDESEVEYTQLGDYREK